MPLLENPFRGWLQDVLGNDADCDFRILIVVFHCGSCGGGPSGERRGVMEKNMETTITGLYRVWGLGIVGKKMETTIKGLYRVLGLGSWVWD